VVGLPTRRCVPSSERVLKHKLFVDSGQVMKGQRVQGTPAKSAGNDLIPPCPHMVPRHLKWGACHRLPLQLFHFKAMAP
jgi:hypothetical protein